MFSFTKRKISSQSKSILNKKQQKHLQGLTEDAHKSRIAVQHIARIRKDCPQQNVNIDQIKNELSQCISQINCEQKKQILLKQLIGLLKGQMNKIQIKQMEIKQKQMQNLNKKIKQLREDIDKILLKKNHEVAKIAVLKQTASQNRSQRVVFSNLFKKLEKQLKESQEIYKNQLLRGQKNRIDFENPPQKLKSFYGKQVKPTNIQNHSYFVEQIQSNTPIIKIEVLSQKISNKMSEPTLQFLKLQTSHSQAIQSDQQNYAQNSNHVFTHRQTRSRLGRLNPSKQNFQGYQIAMQQLQKFCNRIRVKTDCNSVQQIIQLMGNIQIENSDIQNQILDISKQIDRVQKQKNKVELNTFEEIIEDDQFQEFQQGLYFKNSLNNFINVQQNIIVNTGNKISNQKLTDQQQNKSSKKSKFNNKQKQNNNKQIFSQFQQILHLFNIKFNQKQEESLKNQQISIQNLSNLQIKQKSEKVDQIICQLFPKQKNCYNFNKNLHINSILQQKSNSFHANNHNNSLSYHSNINNSIDKGLKNAQNNIQQSQPIANISSVGKNKNVNKVKMSYLEQKQNQKQGQNEKQCYLQRRESVGQINLILNKMDKFGSCQKFFDKEGFYGEYKKQMGKKIKFNTHKRA